MPFLIQKLAGQQSLSTLVPGDVLRIGRGTNAELRFDDAAVALEHAVIERDEGGYRLLDRGSVTGTYFNGKPVHEARLAPGDAINLGNFQILVEAADPHEPLVLAVRAFGVAPPTPRMPPMPPAAAAPAKTAAAPPPPPRLRAPVVDFVAAFGLRRRFLNQPLLAVGLALATAVILLSLTRAAKTTAFEPGGVHRWHRDTPCASCHSAWRGPDPALCADCHARQPETGQIHQARQTFTPPCTGCHPEHRGGDRAAADDRACVVCHADLQVKPAVSAGAEATGASGTPAAEAARGSGRDGAVAPAAVGPAGPRFARHVGGFAADHPEFSVTLPNGARLPLAEAVARQADPTPLRFNHRLHLRPALPTPSGQRVQLGCGGCHRQQAGGGATGILPITYDTACTSSGCHPLTFDQRRPDRVAPHADPRRVREFLLSVYADQRQRNESVGDLYRRLVRSPTAPPREIDLGAQSQRAVVLAERYLFGTACKECHIVDFNAKPLPKVTWSSIPDRWLPYALFSHPDHRASACQECHGGAAASTVAADVLLPSIAVCQRCHGGGPGAAPATAAAAAAPVRPARADCLTCHRYHPASPRPARQAVLLPPPLLPPPLLPASRAGRSIDPRTGGGSGGSAEGPAP